METIGNRSGGYDEYKQQAQQIAEKVGETASAIKDKALDWLSYYTGS